MAAKHAGGKPGACAITLVAATKGVSDPKEDVVVVRGHIDLWLSHPELRNRMETCWGKLSEFCL